MNNFKSGEEKKLKILLLRKNEKLKTETVWLKVYVNVIRGMVWQYCAIVMIMVNSV